MNITKSLHGCSGLYEYLKRAFKESIADILSIIKSSGDKDLHDAVSTLKLLVCSPRQTYDARKLSFPFSRKLYNEVANSFQFPRAVVGYAAAEGTMINEFEAFDGGSGLVCVMKSRKLLISYDIATSSTCALLWGLCAHEIQKLIAEIERLKDAAPMISALIASWLNVVSQLRGRYFVDRKLAILKIERMIGLHWSSDTPKSNSLRDIDFQELTRRLMVLCNAWDDTAIDFQLGLISRLLDTDVFPMNEFMKVTGPTSLPVHRSLLQTKNVLIGIRNSNDEIKQRANVALQTVSLLPLRYGPCNKD